VKTILAACVILGGCALVQPRPPAPEAAPLGPGEIRSAQAANDAVAIGKSTKADVKAAFGEAVVIDFDSGYEVWVYRERLREKAAPPQAEFVLLFAPTGILAKTRIRRAD
jgi:hypothetical protein